METVPNMDTALAGDPNEWQLLWGSDHVVAEVPGLGAL